MECTTVWGEGEHGGGAASWSKRREPVWGGDGWSSGGGGLDAGVEQGLKRRRTLGLARVAIWKATALPGVFALPSGSLSAWPLSGQEGHVFRAMILKATRICGILPRRGASFVMVWRHVEFVVSRGLVW